MTEEQPKKGYVFRTMSLQTMLRIWNLHPEISAKLHYRFICDRRTTFTWTTGNTEEGRNNLVKDTIIPEWIPEHPHAVFQFLCLDSHPLAALDQPELDPTKLRNGLP